MRKTILVLITLVCFNSANAQLLEWGQRVSSTFHGSPLIGDIVYSENKIYAIGTFSRNTLTVDSTVYTAPGNAFGRRGFICRFNEDGSINWVRLINAGGSGFPNVNAYAITSDTDGNVIVGGGYRDSITIDGTTLAPSSSITNNAFFLAKLDSNGTLDWANSGDVFRTLSFNGNVIAGSTSGITSIATDDQNQIYASGIFRDSIDYGGMTGSNSVGTFNDGHFVIKTAANGVGAWLTTSTTGDFDGMNPSTGSRATKKTSLAIGDSGEVYVSASPGFGAVSYGTHNTSFAGSLFLMRLDNLGSVVWSRRFGSSSFSDGVEHLVFSNNKLYVVGTSTNSFSLNGNTFTPNGSLNTGFYSRFTDSGTLEKVTKMVSTNATTFRSIAVNDSGEIFLLGDFNSNVSFAGRSLQASGGTGFNSVGSLAAFKYIDSTDSVSMSVSSSNSDLMQSNTIIPDADDSDLFYIAGYARNSIVVSGKTVFGSSSSSDFFLLKLRDCSKLQATAFATTGITQVCPGTSVQIETPFDTNNIYQWVFDNGFTVGPIPGETDTTYTAPVPGDYRVIVNQNGCIDTSDAVTITNFTAPTVTMTVANSSVCQDAPPITLTGGSPAGGSYSGPGVIGSIFTPSVAGIGTATIQYLFTDSNGCSDSATANINVQPAPTVFFVPFVTTSCSGDSPFALTGGFPVGGTYSGPGIAAGFFNPATAGVGAHTILYNFSNAQGCGGSDSITITVSASPNVTLGTFNDVCNTAGAFPVTGGSPFGGSYSGPGVAFNSFFPQFLTPGSYPLTYTVTQNNCSAAATQNIQVDPPAVATLATLPAVCLSDPAFTLTGGSPAGGIYVGPGVINDTTFDPFGSGIGTFQIGYVVNNACGNDTAFQNIVVGAALSGNVFSRTNVSCNGGSDGGLRVSVSGGINPYTYNWSNGLMTDSIDGLTGGSYIVTVTDSAGCTLSLARSIIDPTDITAFASSSPVKCVGGTSSGTASVISFGGTGTLLFTWNAGGAVNSDTNTGLTAGTYIVTVTDANGCTKTSSTTVAPAPTISATATASNASCNGSTDGTATAIGSGGTTPYTYVWNAGGATTAATNTGLGAATYTATVTDAGGCTASATVTVNEPTSLSINATAVNVLCNGNSTGSATVTATGGTGSYTYAWNAGGAATVATNTSLAAGTYTVTVTDANSCSTTTTATVTEPATAVSVGISSTTNVSCNGASTGSATALATGGTGALTYSWNTGGNTAQATNGSLAAGTYTVVATDANGCAASTTATITEPTALSLTATATGVTCPGGANSGTATAVVTGGSTPYTYAWNAGGATTASTNTGLAAGTYTVVVTDANGCTETSSTTVAPAPVLSSTTAATNVNCFDGNDGTATVTVTGGVAPLTYAWNTGGDTSAATNTGLIAGTYTVLVTDAAGCTISDSQVVTQPTDSLDISLDSFKLIDCFGDTNGHLGVLAIGGTTPYTYLWNDGNTNAFRTNVSIGAKTITVTDVNGCAKTGTYFMSQPTQVISQPTSTDATCNGANDGSLFAGGSGGVFTFPVGYQYNWSNGSTAGTQTGIAPGTYTLTVTDDNACSASASTIVGEPSAVTISFNTITNVQCSSPTSGAIAASAAGGSGSGYTYAWNAGGATNSATNTGLAAGTYTLTVTDSDGCTTSDTAVVTPAPVLSSSTSSTDANCNGGADGTATIVVTGGTAPLTYAWNAGGAITAATNTGLAAGTYTVTATDGSGCTVIETETVSEPTALSLTTSALDVDCNGSSTGSASVTVTGGTAPYTYAWNAGGNTTADTNTGLAAGTYTIVVTDGNGCTNSATATVNQPAAASSVAFATVTDITCNGTNDAAASVMGSGGTTPYTYTWSAGAFTSGINNSAIPAGVFTVTLTDGNGCTATVDSIINEPAVLASLVNTQNVSCNGFSDGTAAANTVGGTASYNYAWSTGAATDSISGLTAGTYSLITTDQNNCGDTVSIALTEPTLLTTSSAVIINASCNGTADGSITIPGGIGGAGGYSFLWDDGSTTAGLILLTAGNYTVTITDANACVLVDTLEVTEPNAINLSITSTNILCNGSNTGSVSATVTGGSGGFTYLWSGGTSTTSATNGNLVAGTYTLTVTDANNCTATDTVVITEPNQLTISTTSADALCNGASNGQASAFGNGGTLPYTFAWSNLSGNNVQINLSAGTYTVTLTDANNCSTTSSVIIGEPAPLSANGTVSNEQCEGDSTGSISLSTIGGTPTYTYAWSDGNTTSNPTGLGVGTYTVTITDANFCTINASYTIGFNFTAPTVNLGPDTTICLGSYMLDAGAGFVNYQWSVPSGNTSQITAISSNTYSVTVTDVNSCTGTDAAIVTVNPSIQTTLAATNSTCGQANGDITATATGGTPAFTYSWSNAGQAATINGLAAGIYTVTVSDANGCSSVASTGVSTTNGPNITTTKTDVSCFGGSNGTATATPVGGGTGIIYSWSNAGSTATISNLAAGTYTVTATDPLGCQTFGSVIINQPPQVTLVTSSTIDSCASGNGSAVVFVSGNFGTPTYAWSDLNNQTTAIASGLVAGTYTVTVGDGTGCTYTSSATVTAPSALSTIGTATNVNCQGGNTGAISTTTSGGASPFNYAWNNGNGTNALSGIAAGSYTLTVTDNYGCTTINNYTIGTNFSSPTVSLGADSTLCAGAYTLDAGAGFANYNWSTGQSTPSISVSTTGLASVTVTDVNGCQASDTVNLVFQPAINITLAATDANCSQSNGAVNATVSGGGSSYTYAWSNSITTDTNTGLAAGLYTLTVTDAIGCSNTATGTVGNINGPTASLTVTDATCAGGSNGSITSTATGGSGTLTYSWSNALATNSISGLTAGAYTLTVTDAAGCQAVVSDTVNEPAAIFSSTTSAADVCGLVAGSATVFAGGGTGTLTYLWNDANAQTTSAATALGAGTYMVTITDANGCSMTDTAVVTGNTVLVITGTSNNVTCQGGNNGDIAVSNTGGTAPFNYAWNTGQAGAIINNLVAGTYTVTTTDANGCSANDTYTVGFDFNNPTVNLGNDTTSCAGNLSLNAGSGFSGYAWNTSDITPTLSVNASGNYSVTVTDANGCTGLDTIDVNFHPAINLATSVIDAACGQANGIASANATGGSGTFLFSWSNASSSQTITGLSAGIYTVTATDGNACTAVVAASVSNANGPSVNTTAINVSCFGASDGSANAIATGGSGTLNYAWSNGQTTCQITGLVAGTYTVTVTDTAGCQDFGTANVAQPAQIVMVASTTQSTCGASDGSATVNASGGSGSFTYLWNDPNTQTTPTASALAAGIYGVTITDASGCVVDTSLAVNDVNGPSITLTSQNELCGGNNNGWAKVTATGTAPFTYSWNDPNFTTIDSAGGLGAGNYFVFVSDANGCQTIGGVTINSDNASPLVNLGLDANSCGDTLIDAGAGFAIYTWSTGSGTSTTTITQTGTYTVTVFNAAGCSASDDVTITISPAPSIDLGTDTTVCIPQAITLDAGAGFVSYLWNTGTTTQSIAPADSGNQTYGVVATTANGCTSSDSINVVFDICLDVESIVAEGAFNVYPNPSTGQLYLDATDIDIESINITDMAGRSIAFDAVDEGGRINVNVAERVTGIYAVRFIAGGQLKIARVAID